MADPWEQRENEPGRWYARFLAFRDQGSGRALESVWSNEKASKSLKKPQGRLPGAWKQAAETWAWRKRAEAWDKAEQDRKQAEREAEREADRAERVRILKAYREKLELALMQLSPGEAGWADVTSGLRMVTEQVRADYDDLPTQRSEQSGEIGVRFIDYRADVAAPEDGPVQNPDGPGADEGRRGGETVG